MGCFVTKGTYLAYQKQAKETADELFQLEYLSTRRQLENDIEEIDLSDRADYLAYQEQLRTKHVINHLTRILSLEKYQMPEISGTNLTHGNYFMIRCDQTEKQFQIAERFQSTISILENLLIQKKAAVEARLNILIEFMKKCKVDNLDAIVNDFMAKFQILSNTNGVSNLITNLFSLSKLQKDMELLQRRCDYKNFLLSLEARAKAKVDADAKVIELKADIDKLNANWTEMKDSQRKAAELMQGLQDTIENNKVKLLDLEKEGIEIRESLAGFDGKFQSLAQTTQIFEEKKEHLFELENTIRDLMKESENLETDENLSHLQEANERLKDEITEIINQKKYLEAILNANIEETQRKTTQELDLKLMMMKDLESEVTEKAMIFLNLKVNHNNERKAQVIIRITQAIKNSCIYAFNKWEFITHNSNHVKPEEGVLHNNPILDKSQGIAEEEEKDNKKPNKSFKVSVIPAVLERIPTNNDKFLDPKKAKKLGELRKSLSPRSQSYKNMLNPNEEVHKRVLTQSGK